MYPSKELEAVVRRFLDARVALDIDAMKVLNSRSEVLRQIGSDRDEWVQGFDGTVQAWIDNQFQDSWRVAEASLLRIEAYENGETGWAAVEQERTLVNGQVFVFRITMVFVLEDYAWKLIQIHFSIPVANEQVLGVSLTSTLTNLLTAIDTSAESDDERERNGRHRVVAVHRRRRVHLAVSVDGRPGLVGSHHQPLLSSRRHRGPERRKGDQDARRWWHVRVLRRHGRASSRDRHAAFGTRRSRPTSRPPNRGPHR